MATGGGLPENVQDETSTSVVPTDVELNNRQSRVRKRTEKGELYDISRLKLIQTSSLSSVTRKRNELNGLMTDNSNLHLVKSELDLMNDLFTQYQSAYIEHYDKLTSEVGRATIKELYEVRENSFMDFQKQVKDWIQLNENQLSQQLDHASVSDVGDQNQTQPALSNIYSDRSKFSRRSKSISSFSSSAQVKEKAKIAELMAERSMLKRKQAIKAAEEELKLDTEIAKAQARERVFQETNEMKSVTSKVETKLRVDISERPVGDQEINVQPQPKGQPSKPTFLETMPTSNLSISSISDADSTNIGPLPLDLPVTKQQPKDLIHPRNPSQIRSTEYRTPQQTCDPTRPEFFFKSNAGLHPSNSVHPFAETECKYPSYEDRYPIRPVPEPSSNTAWADLLSSQRRYNEHIIEANRRLAIAMTLPQPDVPKFSGDPLNYQPFMMSFKARIETKTNLADCLYYLNQYLQGEPKELISGCLYADPIEGYIEAKKLLNQEYGNPYKISTAYINKVLNWQTLKSDDTTGLKRFSFFLKKCNSAMKSLTYMLALDHPSNMQIVVQKLPFGLQNRWRERVENLRRTYQRVPSFEDLVNFVDSCAAAANDPIYGKAALKEKQVNIKEEKRGQDGQKRSSFVTVVGGVGPGSMVEGAGLRQSEKLCPLCNQNHDLEDCKDFLKKSIEEKKSFLKDKRLCFGCYGNNHVAKGCLNKRSCKTCGKRHPTALHIPGFRLPSNKTEEVSETSVNLNSGATGISNEEPTILHAILPVRVKHRNSNKVIATYAFYDNGSDGCFLTDTLRDKLELSGITTTLRLGTMHGQSYVPSRIITNLVVTDLQEQNPIEIPKLYTREFIPVDHNQIPVPEVLSNWKYLEEVLKKVPPLNPELEIGLLIGSNCPIALEPQRVVPSEEDGPFAIQLRHGWTINGPSIVRSQSCSNTTTVNRIKIREVERVKEILTPTSLVRTLEMDFNDHAKLNGKVYSQEDRLFMEKAERNACLVDGHYQLPLPFRRENITLPNNRSQAIQRAKWQRKKMLQNETYHRDYVRFVEDLIAHGYAEPVSQQEISKVSGKIWYLPHHGLYHAKKPNKIRIVFDCSARYQETSLNDHLLQGPDLTNTLFGVLTRFRQGKFAFMADIESMFHQVRVPIDQRDFLRFVWWPGGDLHKPMVEYRMTVHIFGAVSSPSCANFSLRKTATDNRDEFNPAVVQTILNNFYVDDCLKSNDDQDTTCDLIVDLRRACAKGGFRLTKFTSNSRAVLSSIPEGDRAIEVKCLDLDHNVLPIQRALGVQWCVESDQFNFRITLSNKPLTRRGILSVVSSVYDPFGFIAPFVLPAKKILQDLCKEECLDWDDEIPERFQMEWAKWMKELPEVEKLFVNRCMKPSNFGQVVSRQIHIFSDASLYGYGAVAYIRLMDDRGTVHCSFLLGKSRLSPVKVVTIPRLELVAAALSARMGSMLLKELDDKPDIVRYYTDSTTVLRYVSSDRCRFQMFVANRVQAIREVSEIDQWRYVTTKENPADDASRGILVETLLKQSRWLTGPKFLWEAEVNWPEQPLILTPVDATDPEVKRSVTTSAICIDNSLLTINKFFEFYSSWNRLRKGVAILLRLRMILTKLSQMRKDQLDQTKYCRHLPEFRQPITVQELEEAEISIIRCVQIQEFSSEMCSLKEIERVDTHNDRQREKQKKFEIRKTSSIYRVNPFIHRNILRVGGRLRRSNLTEEEKHPYILPRKSHITTLLIRHVHQRLGHAGRGHVLAALREKYWIICANAAVRNVLYRCVTCRRVRSKPSVQKLADLPEERLTVAPPFTYVGVDYFGPFMIKERRRELKRYAALFNCMASRAVHIEITCSLDASSFIQALRRFIARRGPVRQIRSDNGTNFVGANKELSEALKKMDKDLIREKLCQIKTEWIFNPPSASHVGGVWERQIRTIRQILNGILYEHGSCLDDESLRTMICEVEAIVNSRPITFVSNDVDDLQPLSPNNLLTMKSNIILPPPGNFQREDIYMRRRWRRVQYLANLFWSRWKREYLTTLQNRQKWVKPKRNMAIGDIVIIKEENRPRGLWTMGKIIAIEPDKEGFVRSVTVKTSTTEIRRPIHKLVVLLKVEEQMNLL